jgi:poly(hydroxyalkanoate) depolymerase family esterase
MRDLSEAMAVLQTFRRKFEILLAAARKKAARVAEAPYARATRLREVTGFGANPGNLRMFAYVPDRLPSMAPLVVALHGCSQTADEYDYGAGWSSLSDRLGFVVVYPQQQPVNNPKNCFSWFSPDDITRGQGEALSIRQMIEHAIASYGVDRRRVFVTGLSAGGAMASVMLATYPEVFAGGAIIAGLPYGCARTVQQAFEAMFTEQSTDATVLGDRVRVASRHRGPWPKISIWHGTADPIVKPSNSEDLVRQWTNVHGISATPSYEESIGRHRRRVWSGADGEALIEAFSVSGMAHGVPLAMGEDRCGVAGAFFLDAGISSIDHIASFWCLHEDLAEIPRSNEMVSEPRQIQTHGRALVGARQESDENDFAEASSDPNAGQDAPYSFDPNLVIAAAFKAAGLPIPNLPSGPRGAAPHVAPGPIIEAALKSAGLLPSA